MNDEPIGLAEAIRRLRAELVEARAEGEGEDLRFRLGPVDLELTVEVSREAGGDAGIRVWVVSAGGRASVTDAQTHRVHLSLLPQVRVHDRWEDALVGGEVTRRPPPGRAAR